MESVDEEPSLQEALRLIDDWDTDFAALFGLEDGVSTPPRKRPRGRPNAKLERLALQDQLGQLQHEVASLSAARSVSSRDADALWSDIAARQREQRFAAEVENAKLRQALDGERTAVRRLAQLAIKVTTIGTALGSCPEACVDLYKGPHIDPRAHLARLDGLRHEALAVFSSGVFADHAGRDFRDVAFKQCGRDGLLIELSVSWLLPFAVASVVDALWFQTTRMPRKERTTNFKDIFSAECTLVSRFVSDANTLGTIDADHLQPVSWSTHGQIATRYDAGTTTGSVLLVSNMDVKNYQEDGSCRSLMQGNGFLLVEPPPPSETSPVPVCRVKWRRRVQGCAPDESVDTMAEYSRLVHSLTSRAMREKWLSSIDVHLQAIENWLFDVANGCANREIRDSAPSCLGPSAASDKGSVV